MEAKAAVDATAISDPRVTASVRSDAGCVRETNEDCGRFFSPSDPALLAGRGVLAVVADGMGGHAAGEVASRMAVDVVGRAYYRADGAGSSATDALRAAFAEANAEVFAAAQADEGMRGMGTTCTALALLDGSAIAAHVGDSRLYLLRSGEIYLLSEDHSAVGEMVKHGIITHEEARTHEDKNVILRALGTAPAVEVSTWDAPLPVRVGDRFLLCSDGLHDLVRDEEIVALVHKAADAHEACEGLVAEARARGGHDNITVCIVTVAAGGAGELTQPRETREVEVKA